MDPLIRAEVVIGENTRQLLVERNVTLTIPAIKVRNITAKVVNITTDVIADKVVVQGVLHKQIFFVGEDNIVHHQAEDIPFSTFIDVPGAEPGMNVQVDPVVETVIFHLLSPTLLHQKVVLEFFVKITETRQLNVVSGSGPLVRVDQVVGENTKQELFENIVTLTTPAIKIDDITVVIKNITTHIIQDKVIIQGIIHKQIFFIATNNIEFHQGEDIEFSTFVDVPGATPGMDVEVVPTVEFVNFELQSPTTLIQKVVVEFFAKVTESVQINILLGPGALLKLDTVTGENTTQILVENVFTLPIPTVKIREIVASIRDIVTEVIQDKVVIQGILHKQIFFIGEDNLEHHQAEDIPFSTFVDVIGATPGMNVRVDSRIETILFELLDTLTLRQKVVIEFFVKVTETQQLLVQIVTPYYM
jgi:ribosome biogenesis SPOUT family RNA methylase Rps3